MKKSKEKTQIEVLYYQLLDKFRCGHMLNKIYLHGKNGMAFGKDITAYVELENPISTNFSHAYENCKLIVYTNCQQHINWRVDRVKRVKTEILTLLKKIKLIENLPCEDYRSTELSDEELEKLNDS